MAELQFLSLNHLKTWLQQHPDGRKIVEELLDETTRGRERVLLVGQADANGGVVEVYADRSVIFHQVVKPHAITPEGQILAEEWVDLRLPLAYKHLYWPVKLRSCISCRHLKQTPEQILDKNWMLKFIQACTELRKESSNGKKTEASAR